MTKKIIDDCVATLQRIVDDTKEYWEPEASGDLTSQDRELLSDSMLHLSHWAAERLRAIRNGGI
jgi:hypothetical protein